MRAARLAAAWVTAAFATANPVVAQPTEMYECISWGFEYQPDCAVPHASYFDGCRSYTLYGDRVLWFPLRYAGAITVEILAAAADFAQFPLYVEIVPLSATPLNCNWGFPGIMIGTVRGSVQCGGVWERFGPVPLDAYVSIGSTYAVQVTAFDTHRGISSPAIDCIRVTVGTSAAASSSWGRIKSIYK